MQKFSHDMIIWDANVSRAEIEKVVEAKALPEGTIIKLDRLFFETESKSFITWLQERGHPVFYDAKIVDTPDRCLAIAQICLKYHPFMLSIMAGACSTRRFKPTGKLRPSKDDEVDVLIRFVEACKAAGTRSCAITVLPSKTTEMTIFEFNGTTPADQIVVYAELAYNTGMTDIVCDMAEAGRIFHRNYGLKQFKINATEVQPQDAIVSGSRSSVALGQLIENGADRLIIGERLLAGYGSIEDRVSKNYALVSGEILRAIDMQNALDSASDLVFSHRRPKAPSIKEVRRMRGDDLL